MTTVYVCAGSHTHVPHPPPLKIKFNLMSVYYTHLWCDVQPFSATVTMSNKPQMNLIKTHARFRHAKKKKFLKTTYTECKHSLCRRFRINVSISCHAAFCDTRVARKLLKLFYFTGNVKFVIKLSRLKNTEGGCGGENVYTYVLSVCNK